MYKKIRSHPSPIKVYGEKLVKEGSITDDYLKKNPDTYNKISSLLETNNMNNFLKVYSLFVNHRDQEDFSKIKVKTLINI